MADIVIINPRFDISFWGLEHCMKLFGKRANLPVACLALLAALVPDHHDVTVIDENVEDIDFDRLGRADLVCLTGMSIQGQRLIEILEEVRSRASWSSLAGRWRPLSPKSWKGLPTSSSLAKRTKRGRASCGSGSRAAHQGRYEQAEKTDMARLPLPRSICSKADRYMFGSLQISRGCPFTCEFCDIIVTFGRKPRLKDKRASSGRARSFRASWTEDRLRRR